MEKDARFEDAGDAPLHLKALKADDLAVIAALVQDAVFPAAEMAWQAQAHRFAILLNRFRWEDRPAAARAGRAFERVRSLLVIENVLKVRSQGLAQGERETVLSLLETTFEPGADGAGRVLLTLAGDGALALDVEALEVTLKDVTRPYVAPSHKAPSHDI